jgi:kynureninase
LRLLIIRKLTPITDHAGAKESEVAHTSTLTSNIHSLFISFYRPTKTRWRIVIEKGAFPSDWVSVSTSHLNFLVDIILYVEQYAIHSHPPLHNDILTSEQIDNAIVPLSLREGEDHLRTSDILQTLTELGDEVAVVWIGGVQYYTGQFFEVGPIAKKTHEIVSLLRASKKS